MTVEVCIKAAQAELKAAEADLVEALGREKSRRRGPLVRRLHEVRQMLAPARYRYFSQAGQDAVVDRLTRYKTGGRFLDVGGYDGLTGSNTLFLEMFRGWTGLLVEPAPGPRTRAEKLRRCPCLEVAVTARGGEAEFIEVRAGLTQMSGLAATYDARALETVRADPRHREVLRKVPTRTLPDLLEELGTDEPDLVSLDIEGCELAVLEAFPFDSFRPRIWTIENNAASPEIPRLMRAAGYELIEFCGQDEVYLVRPAD